MSRVRALSNHPYHGRMRIKGDEYEAEAADVDLLVALRRVVPVHVEADARAYATREMQASVPIAGSGRSRRRAAPPTEPSTDAAAPPIPDEQ